MDVTPTPKPTAARAAAGLTTAAGAAGAKSATEDAGAMAGDFETFLTLLTTQLKNQDPLKPMESTEFVAQLASFSSVEQQVRTNDQLERIFDALGGGAQGGLAAWIGKEVRAPAASAFSGVPIEIEVEPMADADRAEVVVTNDFGSVVARRALAPTATGFAWDGKTALGDSLPHGSYSFAVESYKGDALLGSAPGQAFSRVTEVRIEDGGSVLVLEGGGKVALDDVTALR